MELEFSEIYVGMEIYYPALDTNGIIMDMKNIHDVNVYFPDVPYHLDNYNNRQLLLYDGYVALFCFKKDCIDYDKLYRSVSENREDKIKQIFNI